MKLITGRERTAFPWDKTRASPVTPPSLESWRTRRISSTWNPSPYPPQRWRTSSSPSSSRRTPTRTTSSRRGNGQKIRSPPRRTRRSRAMRICPQTASPPPPSASPPLVQIWSQSAPLVSAFAEIRQHLFLSRTFHLLSVSIAIYSAFAQFACCYCHWKFSFARFWLCSGKGSSTCAGIGSFSSPRWSAVKSSLIHLYQISFTFISIDSPLSVLIHLYQCLF